MTDKLPIVVGMGEVLWDCLPEGRKLGGAPANFAYHASCQGCRGIVVSAIGADELGDEIEYLFAEKDLEGRLQRVAYPTGTVNVTVDSRGVPTYNICEGVAWDHIRPSKALDALAGITDCLCFGSLAQRSPVSREAILRFAGFMRHGAIRIFDINLRGEYYNEEIITDSLNVANVLKINDEELEVVTPMLSIEGDVDTRCRAIMEKYALHTLILTCGASHSTVYYGDGCKSIIVTPKVDVVDTVGAGDSFGGAYCAAILRGATPKVAHALAVKVSAYVCTQAGAMPKMRSFD